MFELHFVVVIFLRFLGEFCFAVFSTFITKIYLRRTHINLFFANFRYWFFFFKITLVLLPIAKRGVTSQKSKFVKLWDWLAYSERTTKRKKASWPKISPLVQIGG